jgi:antitoxin component of MazEF toxin-antitoxin module
MKTKIARHGNSRAVVLPAEVIARFDWTVGMSVEVDPLANAIVIRPSRKRSIMKAYERVVRDHDELFRRLADR